MRPAGGVDIKRVQEYLGHHSAALTLDVYGHLMPNDEERSLRLVEAGLDSRQDASEPVTSLATDM